ncbi:hypothetical protein [Parafannyhessea umbonata]|uniref:hypothetical protein n=1 Tax=Parafannyhessea umbonata TaxID=604330 RepID=UPI0026ECC01D|nr:hypothetical protein [Parafannyhessea umbonata]MDD7198662.1 hypothetical protein [Parafannyhessea umbonata]
MADINDVYRFFKSESPTYFLATEEGGDWWRVSGEFVPYDRVEVKRHMLDAHPALRKIYDENDNNANAYFKNATARFNSMAGKPAATVEF